MPGVTKDQFDADFNPFITLVGTLCTAVQNLPAPGDPDFTPEDQAVRDAATAVQGALNKINPPPQP
jgi:hypothetical protein